MKSITTNYEKDFHAWTLENAALLRQRRFAEIDVDNIAEELENMGRNERHELVNRFAVLLAHFLKWRFQPNDAVTVGAIRSKSRDDGSSAF